MYEDCGPQLLSRLENWKHSFIIQVLAVDVTADLNACHAERLHAPFKFLDRTRRVLHRHGTQADEPPRMIRNDTREVIIQ